MEAFLYMQGANSALTHLQLCTNKLDSPAVESLGRVLPSGCWPLLSTLDLSYNSMDYRALFALAGGVKRTRSLTVLKLAACKITHMTSPILCSLLSEDTHLLDVDLAFNILGSKGAEDIASALSKNRTLLSLNLRQNNLGPVGGLAIVNSLVVNKYIKTLILADNKCGDQVIKLLAGRLAGSLPQLMDSVKFTELEMPSDYIPHEAVPMKYPYYRKPPPPGEEETLGDGTGDDGDDDFSAYEEEEENELTAAKREFRKNIPEIADDDDEDL